MAADRSVIKRMIKFPRDDIPIFDANNPKTKAFFLITNQNTKWEYSKNL